MPIRKLAHYWVRFNDLKRSRHFYGKVLGFTTGCQPTAESLGVWMYKVGYEAGHLRFTSSKSFRPALSSPVRKPVIKDPSHETGALTISLSGLRSWLSIGFFSMPKVLLGEITLSPILGRTNFLSKTLLARPSNLIFQSLRLQQWSLTSPA